jgi:pimeloyl-[acyl-carrier protein] methyl ester esterase
MMDEGREAAQIAIEHGMDAAQLNMVVSGRGPDLVLLHGWGMNAGVWARTVDELNDQFRVHCVDLPGHGESAPCAPYTLDALVDVLADALPKRLIVCGWSLGGLAALAWSLRHPGQVERLVLVATSPRFVQGDDWEYGLDTAVLNDFADELARDPRRALDRFVLLQAQGDARAGQVLRCLRECMTQARAPQAHALAAGLGILATTDLRPALRRVAQHALIIHGLCDRIVPCAAARYLESALPSARLRGYDRSAHAPFVDQPAAVARDIREFCA